MHIYIVRMHALIHICRVLHNKIFSKTLTILLVSIEMSVAPSSPNWLGSWIFQGIWSYNIGKGSGIVKLDMAGEKTTRVEEIEERQQEMKENITQMADMVTSLTKGRGITDGPS